MIIEIVPEEKRFTTSRSSGYRTYNLVNWYGDFSSMTEDEFVEGFKQFALAIFATYEDFVTPELIERVEKGKERRMNEWIKFADQKYKRESSKQKFLAQKRQEVENDTYFNQIDNYFFFDVDPTQDTQNGIPQWSTITKERANDELWLRRLYQCLIEEPWFRKSTILSLFYESSKDTKKYSFRPQVKFIMDEDSMIECDRQVRKLREDIARFYSDCRYCGD